MFSICLNNVFLRTFFCIILSNFAYGKTVNIYGTIVDEEGKPLKKTSISLRSLKDQLLNETMTNRKGKFSIKEIKPDFYYLLIENESKIKIIRKNLYYLKWGWGEIKTLVNDENPQS